MSFVAIYVCNPSDSTFLVHFNLDVLQLEAQATLIGFFISALKWVLMSERTNKESFPLYFYWKFKEPASVSTRFLRSSGICTPEVRPIE